MASDPPEPSAPRAAGEAAIAEQHLALSGATSISRNYVPPNGIQGVGEGAAYGFSFTSAGAVSTGFNVRQAKFKEFGVGMAGCGFSWSDLDLVDTLGGQEPSTTNCSDPVSPPDPHHALYKTRVNMDGHWYCLNQSILNVCDTVLKENARNGMQASAMIFNTPAAYADPTCVQQIGSGAGVSHPCIPTEEGRRHLTRLMTWLANRYRNADMKLSNFIMFNEVSHSDYFSPHGLKRTPPRTGTIDVRSNDLSEADKRQWAAEYAKVMRAAHDGIQAAQRTDVMLWAHFDQWFRDQYYPGSSWSINNQYFLDALKYEMDPTPGVSDYIMGPDRDWGIAIHPYGDPSTHSSLTFGLKSGSNPERYVFENLSQLTTQMSNWLRMVRSGRDPSTCPQTKIFASEQSYDGPRTIPATPTSAYPFSVRRDERRIAEWVCRAHDIALKNPSIIAVTHNHFQQDSAAQLDEQRGGITSPGNMGHVGLVPAWITGNWESVDAYLQKPQSGQALDVTGDGVADGVAIDTNGDDKADSLAHYFRRGTSALPQALRNAYVGTKIDVNRDFSYEGVAIDTDRDGKADAMTLYNAQGTVRSLPTPEDFVLNAYAATFRNGGWGTSDAHTCCKEFKLGCQTAPAVDVQGVVDGMNVSTPHAYAVTGRACTPNTNAPVWIDVWVTGGPYLTGGPANAPNGSAAQLPCANNNHVNQRFNIKFTKQQLDAYAGSSLSVAAIMPRGGHKWIGNITMPSPHADYNGLEGRVDELVESSDLITLRGWACAMGVGESIDVHVYASDSPEPYPMGTGIKGVRADALSEPALQATCRDQSSAHRFEISFTRPEVQAHQGKRFHVYAISPVGGGFEVLPRAADFKMPTLPTGYQLGKPIGRVEHLDTSDPVLPRLRGWACLPGDERKLALHVYSGDNWQSPVCGAGPQNNCINFVKVDTTDTVIEPALKAVCATQGDFHRFDITFTRREQIAHEGRPLHVFALHPAGTGPNPVLPRRDDFRMPAPSSPEVVFHDAIGGTLFRYDVWWATDADAVKYRGPLGSACDAGYVSVGVQGGTQGFVLCARQDLAQRSFLVGDVEQNAGAYYSVQAGAVWPLGGASWNTCPKGSRLLATVKEVNGFWICIQ